MDIILEKGTTILAIVYDGSDDFEAGLKFLYFKVSKADNKEVLLSNTPYKIKVLDVKSISSYDPAKFNKIYEIKIKGEVI